MTPSEATSTLLILILQSSPQAALLDWIMQNQPEDLALLEVGEDGILQIREFPKNWGWGSHSMRTQSIRYIVDHLQGPIAPIAWVYERLMK